MVRCGLCVSLTLALFITYSVEASIATHGLDAPLDGRIVGGREVNIKEVPYQVALVSDELCGGAIVKDDVILTAAHCVYKTNAAKWEVNAGTNWFRQPRQQRRVARIVVHPSYNPSTHNFDVAVLKLESPLAFSDTVTTIELAKKLPAAGSQVRVSGWGLTSENAEAPSAHLRTVFLPLMNHGVCSNSYPELTEYMICAGLPQGGKDSCQGDSGGPLVHDRELIGIVSFGEGCAESGYPGVYANAVHLRDWIEGTIEKLHT